ncbi:MAG: ShlB/FhaC/HecB family hemolysin secretion/activation protein [Parasphingopyxis sp.]|uniref:ShlB/FhaC/HecB family hemolysin secretion/activation protein n=1 Tax=Parasphingopyxis sp. TaxID=1920299 RepID=UPI0032EE8200
MTGAKTAKFAIAGAAVLIPALAAAQTATQAGPTREEIRRDNLTGQIEQPRQGAAVSGDIERAPCPLAQPRFEGITFTLRDVVFGNDSVIPAERLRPAWTGYVGQTVPLSVICDIRDRAATIIRSEGYLASVQVPPQEIGDDGIVRMDLLTARVSRVQVRGDPGNSEGTVQSYLQPLIDQPAFNQREAERQLLLMRTLPGYDSRLTLRPSDTPGEVIGDVIIDRTKYVLEGSVQNYGPRSSGRFGGQIRAQINDVTGLGDQTSIGFYSTADFDEALVLTVAHDFALGGSGARLGGEFTYAWNDPTIAGQSPFDTETLIASGWLRYPFLLDQGTQIIGSTGFDVIDQDIEFGGVLLNRDRIRVAYTRVDMGFTDRASIEGYRGFSAQEPRWRAGLSAELRQGVDVFGATERGFLPGGVSQTRVAGRSDATVIRLEGFAELRPQPGLAFVFLPRAQLAFDPLLSYEEFSAGNYTVGRGYDPGAIIGDSGIGFRYEIQGGSLVPRTRNDLAWQAYGFFDAAWIENDDPPAFNPVRADSIYSAGFGVRGVWGDRGRFDVALAVPLRRTDLQTETPDVRLLASVTLRFAQ